MGGCIEKFYVATDIETMSTVPNDDGILTYGVAVSYLGFLQPLKASEVTSYSTSNERAEKRFYTSVSTPIKHGDRIAGKYIVMSGGYQDDGISSVNNHKEIICGFVS